MMDKQTIDHALLQELQLLLIQYHLTNVSYSPATAGILKHTTCHTFQAVSLSLSLNVKIVILASINESPYQILHLLPMRLNK
jgi:hypothetical protein